MRAESNDRQNYKRLLKTHFLEMLQVDSLTFSTSEMSIPHDK